MSGSPFPLPTAAFNAFNLAMDPYQRFLYTNGQGGHVCAYAIDPDTGALAAVSGTYYATAGNMRGGVLVHPSGKYLYAVASGSTTVNATIHAFAIDQTTGALTAVSGSPFDASGGGLVKSPYGVAVDPTGAYLFTKGEAAAADTNYMAGFTVDVATGALTVMPSSPIGPFPGRDSYRGLCFHPTLNVLYTAFFQSSTADAGAFSLDLATGGLTGLTGSPFSLFSSHGSDNITVDRSGRFAYSVGWYGGVISRMRVDGAGNLTKLDGTALGTQDVDTTAVLAYPFCVTVAGRLEALP
jgi:6-phosphogluconolactonase (cycloisomerase 2 family)